MSSPRLLVALHPRETIPLALSRGLPDVEWTYAATDPPGDLTHVEALLMGSAERELGSLDPRSLAQLRFVQRVYTGMDGVPFERFAPEVRFAGNVGGYAPFVAEHAIMLALAAARDLPRAHLQVQEGRLRPAPTHRLLWRKTAVILGYGEIGRAIADRLSGFETRIIGLNRTGRVGPGCDAMYPADQIRDAVGRGDFVFDARPLTKRTVGTVDRSVLDAMRPNAVFINVGRGGTVDEEALYRHLVAHPEFRAALDVWWQEDFAGGKLDLRFPFASLANFVGTPHCAGSGVGVEAYVLERAVVNLRRFFSGEEPRYVVDRSEYESA